MIPNQSASICLPVDLYLDGDLGEWVLDHVQRDEVGHIVTTDPAVEVRANRLNFPAVRMAPGKLPFTLQRSALSVHYHRIFQPEFISQYAKMYNLHPGFLPWGRGYFPVFWALWEETPAGATLHEITAGVDEGPIIAQSNVSYTASDTGWTLHQRVRKAEQQLFLEYWPRITAGEQLPAIEQPKNGSRHTKAEFFNLKKNAPWDSMSGGDLVRLIRALSFSGYSGLELRLNGRTYELHLTEVEPEGANV